MLKINDIFNNIDRSDKQIICSKFINTIAGKQKIVKDHTPTMYIRKWNFLNEKLEILTKYNLDQAIYIYVGSHCLESQSHRDAMFLNDLRIGKASKQLTDLFVKFINYQIIEKNYSINEAVREFVNSKEMYFTDSIEEAREKESFLNSLILIRENDQELKEKYILLSKSDSSLKKEKDYLIEKNSRNGSKISYFDQVSNILNNVDVNDQELSKQALLKNVKIKVKG